MQFTFSIMVTTGLAEPLILAQPVVWRSILVKEVSTAPDVPLSSAAQDVVSTAPDCSIRNV